MIKNFLLSVVIFLYSFDGSCNSLTFTRNVGGEGYIVRGYVDANLLQSLNGSTWGRFYVNVHETGDDYYKYISDASYCPNNAQGAADFMNARLSAGVVVSTPQQFADNGMPWTARISCMSGPKKVWTTHTTTPSPPLADPANCTINYPANISFGSVTAGAVKDINNNVKISCDAFADVKVSFSKSTITLGSDAEVNYYFPGNKKTYNVSIAKNSSASFDVRYSLEKTGKTVGSKTGYAMMIFNWL